VVALWRPISVHLAKLTAETKTPIDDSVVGGLVAALQASAQAGSITLPTEEAA
jgi:hypothetical protein